MLRILLVLFTFVVLLTQSGCTIALGGAKVTDDIVFVEPGGVVRVATDNPVKVYAMTADKKQVVVEKNIAGMYVLPESVYLKLTAEWEKNHPTAPAPAPVKPAAVLPKKLMGMDTVAEEVPTDPPLVNENADHEAWVEDKLVRGEE
jgi:hypothetical protein